MRANGRSERQSGPLKTRLSLTRNALLLCVREAAAPFCLPCVKQQQYRFGRTKLHKGADEKKSNFGPPESEADRDSHLIISRSKRTMVLHALKNGAQIVMHFDYFFVEVFSTLH